MLSIPVSIGEAIDKYSILMIKKTKIQDKSKLKNIDEEIKLLYPHLESVLSKYNYHYTCLYNINCDIWELSDCVRDPTLSIEFKNTLFLETFNKNDARFRIKSKLNKLTSSNLQEQKSYPGNTILLKSQDNFEIYNKRNTYIRYLTFCYDYVIIECPIDSILIKVKILFNDDPHIIIVKKCVVNYSLIQDLNVTPEPICNLLCKYDFTNSKPLIINYL